MSQIIATPIVIPSVRILRLRWPNLGFTAAMENLILVLGQREKDAGSVNVRTRDNQV